MKRILYILLIIWSISCKKADTPVEPVIPSTTTTTGSSTSTLSSTTVVSSTTTEPNTNTLLANWIDPTVKEEVIALYKKFYRKIPVTQLQWTGNFFNCIPGTINAEYIKARIDRIKFIRSFIGIGENIVESDSSNKQMQLLSLIMGSSGSSSNFKWDTLKCYPKQTFKYPTNTHVALCSYNTTDNLYTDPIINCMKGISSRMLLLDPQVIKVGFGEVLNSKSNFTYSGIQVIKTNTSVKTRTPYICWPSAGYFPINFLVGDWTFMLLNADFSKSSVTVTLDGKPYNSKILYIFGENDDVQGISWRMGSDNLVSFIENETYKVTISNVKVNNEIKAFTYKIVVIDPDQ